MTLHCSDNKADRQIGAFWEGEFCKMAAEFGLMFTPLQWHRARSVVASYKSTEGYKVLTLPDITIWTYPGQHHEIKHKSPTAGGNFGLEAYRFDALMSFAAETQQHVMYTIHNHALSGGRDAVVNDIDHWITANVLDLYDKQSKTFDGYSWVNGVKKEVPIHYWHMSFWRPLSDYWHSTTMPVQAYESIYVTR